MQTMNLLKIAAITVFVLAFTQYYCYGQAVKANEEYAEQKAISNDIEAKSKIVPFDIPDWKSLITLNQSGDGNISLPVITVKGRKLSLPITLNYTTSGIKVDQNASEVGLGWSINMGNIVRDFGVYEPDYTSFGKEYMMKYVYGLNGSYNSKLYTSLFNGSTATQTYQFSPINQNKILSYSEIDTSSYTPDLYMINIPGVKSNSFWNNKRSLTAMSPTFIFTENTPTNVNFETRTFRFSQEVSRINELKYKDYDDINLYNDNYNMAAAIGLYPYVKNQKVANYAGTGSGQGTCIAPIQLIDANTSLQNQSARIEYEDYSKFTITQPDGTKYIFGRPLRKQKYMFSEEPFWSVMHVDQLAPPSANYGELWKTDFISEWLLTDIRSNDYYDANSNGIADDGDNGDWIHIQYTDSLQYEVEAGIPVAIEVPKYREWLDFTQTDRASSLMQEHAYVTKITTPIETIDFTNSERFDVNHDYFSAVFNRYRITTPTSPSNYVYNSHPNLYGSVHGIVGPNWYIIPPENTDYTIRNDYPVETRKYDTIKVSENISSNHNLVQNVQFKYADKGSSQELAVSNYLILNNVKQFTSYRPESTVTDLVPGHFLQPFGNGRGKTTLLGLEFRGASLSSLEKINYGFQYSYNPSYDDIHMFQIQKMAIAPFVRESPSNGLDDRWIGYRNQPDPANPNSSMPIPNSISPWKTLMQADTSHAFTNTINWGNPVREDELGYYFACNQHYSTGGWSSNSSNPTGVALNGRNAWSLSGITLPYGGNINLFYGLDSCDINGDRDIWSLKGMSDYATPAVANYNKIVHMLTSSQLYSNYWAAYNSSSNMFKKPYSEYYFMMNNNTGGLRIDSIHFTDQFTGSSIVKRYKYGIGHYTMPPADYWQNYLQGFSDFLYNEELNQKISQNYLGQGSNIPWDFNGYNYRIIRLLPHTRIDNTIQQGRHYYEYIEEINADNSKTRWYYGKIVASNNGIITTPPSLNRPYLATKYGAIKGAYTDRYNLSEILATDLDHTLDIGNYKTEYYNNLNNIVKSVSTDFAFNQLDSNRITLKPQSFIPTDYEVWLPQQANQTSPPQYILAEPNNLANTRDLFYSDTVITPPVAGALGYNNDSYPYPNLSSINFSVVGQAITSLPGIGWMTGYYSTASMPNWFAPLTQLRRPWLGTPYNDASIKDVMHRLYNHIYRGSMWEFWSDGNYIINSLNYKTNQSYILHPIHSQTIISF